MDGGTGSTEAYRSVGFDGIHLLLFSLFLQVGFSVESNGQGSVQSLMNSSILGTAPRIIMTCLDAYAASADELDDWSDDLDPLAEDYLA